MRRLSERELRAVPNIDLGNSFFANRVDVQIIAEAEFYAVLTMQVNAGVSGVLFHEDSPETAALRAEFNMSVPVIQGNSLVLTSPSSETAFYTIDLTPIIAQGQKVTVERLTEGKPSSFGLVICDPAHQQDTGAVHRLSNADYRLEDDVQCGHFSGKTFLFPGQIQCEREQDHLGNHQAFNEDDCMSWTVSGAMSGSPYGQFGFTNFCQHCGFITAGGAEGNQVCSLCSFWLSHHKTGGGFVIKGRHYRPGGGGFGGNIFHLKRSDGTKWSGELFTQGVIPSWMIHLFPDNAAFVE